jgi:hypothetical protein
MICACGAAWAPPVFCQPSKSEAGKTTYELKCRVVPVEDVLIQWGSFEIVGSTNTQMFTLHALYSIGSPALNTTGDSLLFSAKILYVYLLKGDSKTPAFQLGTDRFPDGGIGPWTKKSESYGWAPGSPEAPVELKTEISLQNSHSPDMQVRVTPPTGKTHFSGNGFVIDGVATNTEYHDHGFTFDITYEGSFVLNGVTYKSRHPIGGTGPDADFDVSVGKRR